MSYPNDSKAAAAITKIDQQTQAPYSLAEQLWLLERAAVKLGLYDAADYLERIR